MSAAVHSWNYGRPSSRKSDKFHNSSKYSGFHPNTELSGGSWNSVRWLRPTSGSADRHATLTAQFNSGGRRMDSYTTANRPDRRIGDQYYKREPFAEPAPAWRHLQLTGITRPTWRGQGSDSRSGRNTPLDSGVSYRASRADSYGYPYSNSGRRSSISALQDNNNVLQDAVTALRATADSFTSGRASRHPDEGSRRSSLARDMDLGHSRDSFAPSASSSLSAFSKNWPPSSSTGESSRRDRLQSYRRDPPGSLTDYGGTFYISGMRRNSGSRSGTPGSLGVPRDAGTPTASYVAGRHTPYGGLRRDSYSQLAGLRRDSYSQVGSGSGYNSFQNSTRRNSLLSSGNKSWGFGGHAGSYRSQLCSAPSSFQHPSGSAASISALRRGSPSADSAADLISNYRSKSDSAFCGITAPTLRPFSASYRPDNSASSVNKSCNLTPRKFMKIRRDESEGYDSSSTDSAKNFSSLKKTKSYRKRSSVGSGKRYSKPLTSSMTESSSSGVKSMKDRTLSSSEEESSKGSFETRMRQRRRRLNKSKALVHSENPGSLCGSDSKIPRFSLEKVYLQSPLQSQENLRHHDIMTASAPAVFSEELKDTEPAVPTKSLSPSPEGTILDSEHVTLVIPDLIPQESEETMDVSESSDTLVPDPETQDVQPLGTIFIDPIFETLEKPFECANVEKVFGVPITQTIDFSGLEEFAAQTNEREPSVDGGNIVNREELRSKGETAVITKAVISRDEKAESQEQQPAPNFETQPRINAFEILEHKIPNEFSNFGSAEEKREGKDDRSSGREEETAALAEKIPGSSSHQKEPSPPRTETPRFTGAKRIVVLHSGPNETTVYEKSAIPAVSAEPALDAIQKTSPILVTELAWTKRKEPDEIKIRQPAAQSGRSPDEGQSAVDSKLTGDRRSSLPERKSLHVLPSVDKEVVELLTLGEELNNSRQSLNKSGTDSESGFRTPEIQHLPAPKKALLFTDFNLTTATEPLNQQSGKSTPTLEKQRGGSVESVASSFMTANSNSDTESMKDLTFVLTARPQPFRSSSENLSGQKYGHVEPHISMTGPNPAHEPNKERNPYPLSNLQRTASTTSNDSWVSAASSGRSGSLEAAAKKVDEMLKLARRKHQQNRSRFRDAMDHLDQIYEEIKKEADDVGFSAAEKNSWTENSAKKTEPYESAHLFTPSSSKAARVPEVAVYENVHHHPFNMPSQPVMRDGKFDFTKKWLEDDLHSLATDPGPKPDLLQFGPSEVDQHSVGSASAEIAAITGKEGLAARKIPDLVPQKHQAVIKPSPVRYASYQDVSVPNPPVRKDSLSSVDSARMKVGKFLEKHACADERVLDIKANLGHVKRKADFFGRISDNDSDRDKRSPSFGCDRKPPVNRFLQMAHMKRTNNTGHKAPQIHNLSDEETGKTQQPGKVFPKPYAESTRSLPVYGVAQFPEWRKVRPKYEYSPVQFAPPPQPKIFQLHQASGTEAINSSSNTLTEAECLRPKVTSLSRHPPPFTGRRNIGSEALQTVDHLVAELELNTEEQELCPRAFPTTGIAKYGVDFSALPDDGMEVQLSPSDPVPHKPLPSFYPVAPTAKRRVNLYEDFDDAQKILLNVTHANISTTRDTEMGLKVVSSKTIDSTHAFNFNNAAAGKENNVGKEAKSGYRSPFMTINEEKLGESKVVNMKSMFEAAEPLVEVPSPPKLPVVTSQPPGKGTIPAPIPFRPLESAIPGGNIMESSMIGNCSLYSEDSNEPLKRDASNNHSSAKRAFQQIQSRGASEMLPITAVLPGFLSSSPSQLTEFSMPAVQALVHPESRISKPSLNSSHDDDDYDNVILPSGVSYKGSRSAANSLRHPGPIKINSMRLGEDHPPGTSKSGTSSSKNPIKNLLRKFKAQPRDQGSPPKQSSSLSLNEPVGARLATNLHKSSSVGEAWSQSSSLSLSQDPTLIAQPPSPSTQSKSTVKPPKGKGGRKFWTPWKK